MTVHFTMCFILRVDYECVDSVQASSKDSVVYWTGLVIINANQETEQTFHEIIHGKMTQEFLVENQTKIPPVIFSV